MKRITTLLIFVLSLSYGCKAQSQLELINNYNTQIIGTWIEEEDSAYKLVFLSDGTCKEYYGSELLTTYNYSITGNSCENYTAQNRIYLKWTDINDLQNTCFDILNITDHSLSLLIIDKAERLFFNKQ